MIDRNKDELQSLEKTKTDTRTAKQILDDMPCVKDDYEVEVVVRITKRELDGLKAKSKIDSLSVNYYEKAIINGIELPEGHDDLIDRGKLNVEIGGRCDNPSYIKSIVNDEQAVIPAAKGPEKNETLKEDDVLSTEEDLEI